MGIRKIIREAVLSKHPDAKIRVLEDPPGPPTMATFHVKIKAEEGTDRDSLVGFAEAVETAIGAIAAEEGVEDLENSLSSALPKIRVKLDERRMKERKVSAADAEAALAATFSENPVGVLESR